jgi:hypothetical protein
LAWEVRWLYRTLLRHAKNMQPQHRAEAFAEVQRQFRTNALARDAANVNEATLKEQIKTAYSKLSFSRMSMPKFDHPTMDVVPAFPQARAMFGAGRLASTEHDDGHRHLTYIGGEMVPGDVRSQLKVSGETGRSVVNSQGLTDEQFKRHYAMVDRMQFKGPHWAGKPKY